MFYIYRITNNINGKTYIGQRKCPRNKTPEADKYMGSGKRLWEAYRKYGIENFTKTIIHKFFSRKMTNLAELYYIKKEMQRGRDCYNLLVGAHWEKSHTPWNKGKKIGPHTEEWKAKARSRVPWNKGKHTGITPANKGTHFTYDKDSEEYKRRYLNRVYDHEKLSAAHKGRKWFNNGIRSVLSFECPEGYVAGRIKWTKEER